MRVGAYLMLLLATSVALSFAAVMTRTNGAKIAPHDFPAPLNRTTHIKLQLEELEDGRPAGCVQLEKLNFCEDRKTARYPNIFGDVSESEAFLVLEPYVSLLEDKTPCGTALKVFLCATLAPACSSSESDPPSLPPCCSVCTTAADKCAQERGLRWPLQWTCDRLPTDGLCLDLTYRLISEETSIYKDLSTKEYMRRAPPRGSLKPPPSSAIDDHLGLEWNHDGRHSMTSLRISNHTKDGDPRFFRGFADVRGIGRATDYCRVIGSDRRDRFLSCALGGSESEPAYVSKRGFDPGHSLKSFMRDMDGDGKDDYCRCVGWDLTAQLVCMKAGQRGFYGGILQSGSEYTFRIPESSASSVPCRAKNSSGKKRFRSWKQKL